jgi:hypothetical protein
MFKNKPITPDAFHDRSVRRVATPETYLNTSPEDVISSFHLTWHVLFASNNGS